MFDNTLELTRFMLKRERLSTGVWMLALMLAMIAIVVALAAAIDEPGRMELLLVLESPALVALMGPFLGTAEYFTHGAFFGVMMFMWTALAIAIMNVLLVVRNTRGDEELGRYEVVRSLPVGRIANLNGAMLGVLIVNGILAIALGLGIYIGGLITPESGITFGASMLSGATLGVVGMVFAAVTALFCQTSPGADSAKSYSFITIGVLYFARAMGDMSPDAEILSLINPLGLKSRVELFYGNNAWPIAILAVFAVVLTAIAYKLNGIRDIDQGIIPSRAGRAHGSFLLKSSGGFTFKLLKPAIIAWLVALTVMGASYGTIIGDIDSFIAGNEVYQQLILGPAGIEFATEAGLDSEQRAELLRNVVTVAGYSLPQIAASLLSAIMAILALVPPMLFVLKAKAEEKAIRTELILATPVSRTRYFIGFAGIAFLMALLLQFFAAVGMQMVGATTLTNPAELPLSFMVSVTLVFVPAIWVMTGITIFLVGLLPKYTWIAWIYFLYTFIIEFMGRMEFFPEWTQYTTPFGFTPVLPVDEINWLSLTLLTVVAMALTGAGLFFYSRRDTNAITH